MHIVMSLRGTDSSSPLYLRTTTGDISSTVSSRR